MDDKPLRVLAVDEINFSITRTPVEEIEKELAPFKYNKADKPKEVYKHTYTIWVEVAGVKRRYYGSPEATIENMIKKMIKKIRREFDLTLI